jgi:HlyD family type I secretion membrane fusion protein
MGRDLQTSGGGVPDLYRAEQQPIRLPEPPPLRRDLRATAWIGVAIVTVFFVIGGGWAATAPISGAVIASGVVSPQGSRQTVQHLEGGIIREIRVEEGDRVASGDVLVILQDISAQADVGGQMTRLRALAAAEARLKAERTGAESIAFDHPALADAEDPEVATAVEQQRHQFESRRRNDETRISILEQRIAQLRKQIEGAEQQLAGVKRQKALIREELVGVRELFEKGYERKPRMLELQRTEAGLIGEEGDLVARIARAEEAIGETQIQMVNVTVERMEEVEQELAEVQPKRIELEQEIRESLDRLKRTELRAPVDGVVLDVHFKTEGGVIKPGEPVLDIIPAEDSLIIDTRISPTDIDAVYPGLEAYVMFPSYSMRTQVRVPAKLVHVSADTLEDARSGQPYYQGKVEIDREVMQVMAPEVSMTPGLPAETFIATSERTVLDYLLQPFLQVIEHTFRET